MTAWLLTMVHRKEDGPPMPFSLAEVSSWLGHGFVDEPPAPASQPPTPDELLERAKLLNDVYGGTTYTNGSPEP